MKTLCLDDFLLNYILLFNLIHYESDLQYSYIKKMHSAKAHSSITKSRHYNSRSLSNDNKFYFKCKTLSSVYEAAAKEDCRWVYNLYFYLFHTSSDHNRFKIQIKKDSKILKFHWIHSKTKKKKLLTTEHRAED